MTSPASEVVAGSVASGPTSAPLDFLSHHHHLPPAPTTSDHLHHHHQQQQQHQHLHLHQQYYHHHHHHHLQQHDPSTSPSMVHQPQTDPLALSYVTTGSSGKTTLAKLIL